MSACHMGGLCCKQNPCAYLAPGNSAELDERDAEVETLRARVERLEEALQWLATDSVDPDSRRIARTALEDRT